MKTAYQIQVVAKHLQLLETVRTELLGEWMVGRNQLVRRRPTVRGMLLWTRNSEEAVLPQIKGREAAIAFDKSHFHSAYFYCELLAYQISHRYIADSIIVTDLFFFNEYKNLVIFRLNR